MILLLAFFTLLAGLGSIETERLSPTVHYVEENERDKVCASNVCINKCCSQWEHLDCATGLSCECVKTNETIDFSSVPLYSDYEKVDTKFTEAFAILHSFYHNLSEYAKNNSVGLFSKFIPKADGYLGVDGKFRLSNPNAYERWNVYDNFCIDLTYSGKEIKYDQLILFSEKDNPPPVNGSYKYLMLVSSFFLTMVLIVYAVLPGLRNLPGRILMAYVFSQSMAFVSFSVMQFLETMQPIACEVLTSITYCFFLASFCWMNVMSYDIFWTFRSYAKARQHKHGVNFKFAMYCLYAWGVPLAMTAMMIMMHRADFSDKPWIIKPLINDRGCFLMSGQKFVYLYAPMLILIICNWLFFVLTVFNIWRVSRSTAMARSPASGNAAAHRAHKNRFLLYIKLSVVMGVNWLLEVISSLYPELNGWWVADMYNLLIGFTLFLIFILRRKIYRDLQSKFSGVRLNRWSRTNSSSESSGGQDISFKVSRHPGGSEQEKN